MEAFRRIIAILNFFIVPKLDVIKKLSTEIFDMIFNMLSGGLSDTLRGSL